MEFPVALVPGLILTSLLLLLDNELGRGNQLPFKENLQGDSVHKIARRNGYFSALDIQPDVFDDKKLIRMYVERHHFPTRITKFYN
jgi:hypothetical protein